MPALSPARNTDGRLTRARRLAGGRRRRLGGDESTPPFFYGYIYPEPAGADRLPIAPATAVWSATIKEWVLPYDAVRGAADPEAEVRAFLDSLYANGANHAGWDRAALSYDAPKR